MNFVSTTYPNPSPLPVETLDAAGYRSALDKARRALDVPQDVIIHGLRVRLYTDNPHWQRFWSANWFAPEQWATLTGRPAPSEPRVHLYATAPDPQETPRASYSREQDTAFLWGDTPYGPLRALALKAVAHLLTREQAAHFVPGLCFQEGEQGVLALRPPDTDFPVIKHQAHLLAIDGVFVRYGLTRIADEVTLLPTLIIDEKGNQIPGYRLFPWLDAHGYQEPRADARCLTLEGEETYCFARALDLEREPQAFAFPFEQAWYVPTQIVAAQPELASALLHGGLENVPPATPDLLDRFGAWAREALSAPGSEKTLAQAQEVEILCRLRVNPHARAMVPPEHLWPGRAGGHPWRPLRIHRVALLSDAGIRLLDPSTLEKYLADETDEATSVLTAQLQSVIRADR